MEGLQADAFGRGFVDNAAVDNSDADPAAYSNVADISAIYGWIFNLVSKQPHDPNETEKNGSPSPACEKRSTLVKSPDFVIPGVDFVSREHLSTSRSFSVQVSEQKYLCTT